MKTALGGIKISDVWSDFGLEIGSLVVACLVTCVWCCDSLSKIWLRLGSEACACSTCVGGVMDMRSVSSDGAASFLEAGGAGGDCGIVSRLGSKEVAWLILGFLFFVAIPSEEAESWLAGNELDDERGCFMVNFGFQLEREAISAGVILPMGSDDVEVVCSADSDGDGVGAAGVGSPRHSQS